MRKKVSSKSKRPPKGVSRRVSKRLLKQRLADASKSTPKRRPMKVEVGRGIYVVVLAFAALLSIGIWSRPNWMTSVANWAMLLGMILSGYTLCYALAKISKNRILAVLGAVFYMSSPYVVENFYVKMALAESVALVAAPILLLGLYKLLIHDKHAVRYLAVAGAALVLSQSGLALMFMVMSVAFVIMNINKICDGRNVGRIGLVVAAVLGLTAFFVVPLLEAWLGESMIFDRGYVEQYLGSSPVEVSVINGRRVLPQQLLSLDYAQGGGMVLGAVTLVGMIGFWLIRRTIEDENERRFVTSLYIMGGLAVLLALPIVDWGGLANGPWRIQDPASFLMVMTMVFSIVAAYTVFALIQRVEMRKQAVAMVMIAMAAVALVVSRFGAADEMGLENLEVVEGSLYGVLVWGKNMGYTIREMISGEQSLISPIGIAMMVSVMAAVFGAVWMVVADVCDRRKLRAQQEARSLIEEVQGALIESENERAENKPRVTRLKARSKKEA